MLIKIEFALILDFRSKKSKIFYEDFELKLFSKVLADLGGFEPPTLGSEVPRHIPG